MSLLSRGILALSLAVWFNASVSPALAGGAITLDKPLVVSVMLRDGAWRAGHMTACDDAGFTLKPVKGEAERIGWDRLDGRQVFLLHKRAFAGEGTGAQWLALGKLLWPREDDRKWADRALQTALQKDESLAERVAQVRATQAAAPVEEADANTPSAVPPARQSDADHGPRQVGPTQHRYWGELDPAVHADAVQRLKQFADKTNETVAPKLKLYETDRFLFYSDLSPAEARKWQRLLDRMYSRLVKMFALPANVNVWRGKALVFVFRMPDDYRAFQRTMHNTEPGTSAGMCHSFGDGMVHIAFYRQPDDMRFAHVLVHESVHGFLHRYRTPRRVLSWVNEGLAEWIATELVPVRGAKQRIAPHAAAMMAQHGGYGDMFDATHIQAWQYPIALGLTDAMIQGRRLGYVRFIQAIKDGEPWRAAFERHMGIAFEQFIAGYRRSLR